jgi:hypothetical protein
VKCDVMWISGQILVIMIKGRTTSLSVSRALCVSGPEAGPRVGEEKCVRCMKNEWTDDEQDWALPARLLRT